MPRRFRVVAYGKQRPNPDVHRLSQIVILLARQLTAERQDRDETREPHSDDTN